MNAGLEVVENHRVDGVVYFADEEGVYSLQLFDQLCRIRFPFSQISRLQIQLGDGLSLGEQQRLGMARLVYHKPKFAILDECTSAVTTDMEERFCSRVRAMGTACISVSHRPALVAIHDVVLSLKGEGGWTFQDNRL
jgi:ABC-type glutathione transport system ATPase component